MSYIGKTINMGDEVSMHRLVPSEVSWIISLGRQAASVYLQIHHPELTNEESTRILAQTKEIKVEWSTEPKTLRNRFVAAAWLCGASYRQLARLYGVAEQTISQAINRQLQTLAPSDKSQLRLAFPPIELQRVSAMQTFWDRLCELQPALARVIDPMGLAKMLLDMPITDQESTAYSQLPDSPGNVDRTKPTIESKTESEPVTITAKNFDWSIVEGENK